MTRQRSVRRQVDAAVTGTRQRVGLVVRVTAALWVLELVDVFLLGGRLDAFGVRPRTMDGLWGIPAAPLLHGGLGHLVANTLPLLLLGFLATSRRKADFWVVTVVSTLVGGLGTWLIAPGSTVHIGASGVVFGLLGFLMGRGLFERSLGAIAMSTAVTVLFGGMLWGVLPLVAGPGISWQMHLFGYLGGLFVSWTLGRGLRSRK